MVQARAIFGVAVAVAVRTELVPPATIVVDDSVFVIFVDVDCVFVSTFDSADLA